MDRRLIFAAVVIIAAGTVGWLLGERFSRDSTGSPVLAGLTQTSEHTVDLSSLREEIHRLSAKIDRLSNTVQAREEVVHPNVTGSDSEPELSQADNSDLVRRLGLLQSSLNGLAKSVNEGLHFDAPPTLEEIRSGKPTADWRELESLWDIARQSRNAAVDQVRGMTYVEVLGRFGPPLTFREDGRWFYRPDRFDRYPFQVTMSFRGGYAVGVVCEWD